MSINPNAIHIYKRDHHHRQRAFYIGVVQSSNPNCVTVKAFWKQATMKTDFGMSMEPGDFFIEQFYLNRWYNVMALFSPTPTAPTLKGWYANVTRPTFFENEALVWEDLKLDVWMTPDGKMTTLDEDEFAAITHELAPHEIASAHGALLQIREELMRLWREWMNDQIAQKLIKRKWTIATAESCTGGLLGDTLTNRAGSSAYFMGGVMAYDNRIKHDVLGVTDTTLNMHGAVSEQSALEMAQGVRRVLGVDIGVSVTGIAGPSGATETKPVGLVYIGICNPTHNQVERFVWQYDRVGNKRASADAALTLILKMLETAQP